MIQVGFLLLLCIAVVTPNPPPAPPTPGNPPCVSTCKAVTNFNAAKFAGKWYEVRKIASAPGRGGTCETGTYTANEDDTLHVDIGWVDSAGVTQELSGTIKPSYGKPTDGQKTFTYGEKSEMYTIFYLNYDTVFGGYTCIENKAYVFVFARTQEVADSALGDLNKAMIDSGLDPKSLKLTPRTACPATY